MLPVNGARAFTTVEGGKHNEAMKHKMTRQSSCL